MELSSGHPHAGGCSEGDHRIDVCAEGSGFLSPFPSSAAITDFCLSAFLVYATISITLIFNCLSPFLPLSGLSKLLIHISTQAATGDIQQGKKKTKTKHIKHRADLLCHHPLSLLRLLIYGDRTPVFRLSTFVQTNSHAHSMVQKMIKAKQVLNIKIDVLFCS